MTVYDSSSSSHIQCCLLVSCYDCLWIIIQQSHPDSAFAYIILWLSTTISDLSCLWFYDCLWLTSSNSHTKCLSHFWPLHTWQWHADEKNIWLQSKFQLKIEPWCETLWIKKSSSHPHLCWEAVISRQWLHVVFNNVCQCCILHDFSQLLWMFTFYIWLAIECHLIHSFYDHCCLLLIIICYCYLCVTSLTM